MRVIGFTGMPGSGKSEAVSVAKAQGLPVIRMGDLIWEEVDARGLPREPGHVGDVAHAMRESHGEAVWAARTVDRIGRDHAMAPVVVIDGVRSMAEVDLLRTRLGDDFLLVAIHTDQKERFHRMTDRARPDDPAEASGHAARDQRELGWGIARTIALADEMLVNDGTLPEFHAKVAAFLDEAGQDQ